MLSALSTSIKSIKNLDVFLLTFLFCFLLITGSPREYLEAYLFPVLLPAIEQMLKAAKENKVFEVCLLHWNYCYC